MRDDLHCKQIQDVVCQTVLSHKPIVPTDGTLQFWEDLRKAKMIKHFNTLALLKHRQNFLKEMRTGE